MAQKRQESKPGPAPMRVKIDGDWEAAMGKAMRKPAPEGGWTKPAPMPQRAPKKPGKKKGSGAKPKP